MNPMVEYSDGGGVTASLLGIFILIAGFVLVGIWALAVCVVRAVLASVERSREKPIDEAEIELMMKEARKSVPTEQLREQSLQRLIASVTEPRVIPDDLRELLGPAKRREGNCHRDSVGSDGD